MRSHLFNFFLVLFAKEKRHFFKVSRKKLFSYKTLQILEPSSQLKGPGGYHNVSLKVGPPLTSDDRGRYVCLVNNPQGHKHKEIFLKVANYSSTSKNHFFDPVNPGKKKYKKLGLPLKLAIIAVMPFRISTW